MTLVYRQASPGYQCRTTQDEIVAVTDGNNQRLLHYQRLSDQKRIAFPLVLPAL